MVGAGSLDSTGDARSRNAFARYHASRPSHEDSDDHIGMSYVMNPLGGYLVDNSREKAFLASAYRSVAKLGHSQSAQEAYET